MQVDGSGRVHSVQSLPALLPDEQVLQLMLYGGRDRLLSGNLQFGSGRRSGDNIIETGTASYRLEHTRSQQASTK